LIFKEHNLIIQTGVYFTEVQDPKKENEMIVLKKTHIKSIEFHKCTATPEFITDHLIPKLVVSMSDDNCQYFWTLIHVLLDEVNKLYGNLSEEQRLYMHDRRKNKLEHYRKSKTVPV
jgi:hypothetical protein